MRRAAAQIKTAIARLDLQTKTPDGEGFKPAMRAGGLAPLCPRPQQQKAPGISQGRGAVGGDYRLNLRWALINTDDAAA